MTARDERLYFRLQRTAHLLQKVADRRLVAAAGITTTQAAVLVVLKGTHDATQRDVARALGINESAMTAAAGRLQAQGLISRRRSADDPRAWRLEVTEAGEAASQRSAQAFKEINAMIDSVLDDSESSLIAHGIEKVWERFAKA